MRVRQYVSFSNCWKFKSDCHRVTRKACNKHAIPTVADWKGFKNYCFTCKIHTLSSIMWKILWLQSAWLHYVMVRWRSLILWGMFCLLYSFVISFVGSMVIGPVSNLGGSLLNSTISGIYDWPARALPQMGCASTEKMRDDQVALLHCNGKLQHHRKKSHIIISYNNSIWCNQQLSALYWSWTFMIFHGPFVHSWLPHK